MTLKKGDRVYRKIAPGVILVATVIEVTVWDMDTYLETTVTLQMDNTVDEKGKYEYHPEDLTLLEDPNEIMKEIL